MNYYRITNPVDVRDLGDQMTAWLDAGNPKVNDWAEQPPAPSLYAVWGNGQWEIPVAGSNPRWVDFSAVIMALPAINIMLGAVLQAAPGLAGGMWVGLDKASEGDSRVFLNAWTTSYARGLLSAELITTVQELATEYDLPEVFIDSLAS